jgi:hypothetical protein
MATESTESTEIFQNIHIGCGMLSELPQYQSSAIATEALDSHAPAPGGFHLSFPCSSVDSVAITIFKAKQ